MQTDSFVRRISARRKGKYGFPSSLLACRNDFSSVRDSFIFPRDRSWFSHANGLRSILALPRFYRKRTPPRLQGLLSDSVEPSTVLFCPIPSFFFSDRHLRYSCLRPRIPLPSFPFGRTFPSARFAETLMPFLPLLRSPPSCFFPLAPAVAFRPVLPLRRTYPTPSCTVRRKKPAALVATLHTSRDIVFSPPGVDPVFPGVPGIFPCRSKIAPLFVDRRRLSSSATWCAFGDAVSLSLD